MENVNLVLCGKRKDQQRIKETSHSLIFFAESTIWKLVEKVDKKSSPKMSTLPICSCKLRYRLLTTDFFFFFFP